MTTNAPPSHSAASEDMLIGLLQESYRKFLQQTDNMLPARVSSYNRDTNIAVVRPMINMLTTDGQQVERGEVAVRVFQYGGYGLFFSFPLEVGDLGWIKACDRDISLFLQNFESAPPNTQRLHSFGDAVFFPDIMPYSQVSSEDQTAAVLQNRDGDTKISVKAGLIKLLSATTPSSKIDVEAPNINLDGKTKLMGNVGFYNTAPQAKPTVSGSKSGNAALASLCSALATLGLITDSTT